MSQAGSDSGRIVLAADALVWNVETSLRARRGRPRWSSERFAVREQSGAVVILDQPAAAVRARAKPEPSKEATFRTGHSAAERQARDGAALPDEQQRSLDSSRGVVRVGPEDREDWDSEWEDGESDADDPDDDLDI